MDKLANCAKLQGIAGTNQNPRLGDKPERSMMAKFKIVVARCVRYEVEAENENAAVQLIKDAHYDGNLQELADWSDHIECVDSFTKFESEGELVDEEAEE